MAEEFIQVPYYVERDGTKTHFLPSLRQGKGYRIGEKGHERVISDYWEALAAVCAMPTPRFRRKNSAGNPGIVACLPAHIEEVSRRAIADQINQVERAQRGDGD